MVALLVILAVSAALLIGAAWGLFAALPRRVEGFLIAMAGGALIVSLMAELIEPAAEHAPLWATMPSVALGALCFTALDTLIDRRFGGESGGGMVAAVTLDGVPENLALGVALIGAGAAEVAALAGSIFLANLPEAAGGARRMHSNGIGRGRVLGIWAATAALLSVAAWVGYVALGGVSEGTLAVIRCFAAGAVVASLATEIFPKAFEGDDTLAGVAVAVGLIVAFVLHSLAGGGA